MHYSRVSFFLSFVFFLITLAMIPSVSYGQAFTANLSGVVTDERGAAVPGATVSIRNTATDETRQTTSGNEGRYTFSQLLPGTYDLTAEVSGFKTLKQEGVVLRANQSAEENLSLTVGEVSDMVEVTATPTLLDTESANQSVTFTSTDVARLPQNVRTPFALVLGLAGTTTVSAGNYTNQVIDQQYSRFALNGGRDMSSLILIDGAPATAGDWGGLIISPSVESVQEMQVSRNSYDAEFGKSGGGVVSLVTRGGSNDFHGTLFEFLRNDNLDANSWSNNRAGQERPEFKQHQFGGSISGPIWRRKKLFFYGDYEGLRQRYPGDTGLISVPTDLERRGDFSQTFNDDGSLAVIYNPFTTRADPENPGQFLRDPFPGNIIPQELIDPVGAKVVNLFPAANRPGLEFTNAQNFFFGAPGKVANDKFDARVDWVRSTKHTFYARFSMAPRQSTIAPIFFGNGADFTSGSANPRYHASIGNTFTPSPTWVINVLIGSGRWREAQLSPNLGVADPGSIGLDPSQYQIPLIPRFDLENYTSLGNPQVREFIRYTHTAQANLTKELGAHSLRFGAYGEVQQINNVDRASASFSFGRGLTSGPVADFGSTTTGNAIASLLLGTGFGSAPIRSDLAATMKTIAAYVQDNWRVNRRLTLNLGLRYENQRPATERFDRISYFDPDVVNPIGAAVGLDLRGGLRFATSDDRGQWKADNFNFAPRVGFAYQVSDKLVARGGFGIFYVPASALYTFDPIPGFSTDTPFLSTVGGGGLIPLNRLSNPFPQGIFEPPGAGGLDTLVGFGPNQVWLKSPHPTGYLQNFSIDLQYQFNPGTVIEVGYSGFQGRKLVFGQPLSFNQLPTQYLSLGDQLNELVPNPFFGQITEGNLSGETIPRYRLLLPYPQFDGGSLTRSIPGASASFNAMTVKLTKQFANGASLITSYQWSKNIDNASEDQGWAINDAWRDYYNRDLERSISAHDVPQSFVTSLVYDLPVGKGRKYGSDLPRVAEAVVGGWQTSTIVRLQSGLPLSVQTINNAGAYGFAVQRPNLVTKYTKPANQTPDNWINPAPFEFPADFTIGNGPRYTSDLRESATKNVDLSFTKFFAFGERSRLMLRADFLNLFNHPQFGGPFNTDTFFGSETFGQVFNTSNYPRNIQLGLKFEF